MGTYRTVSDVLADRIYRPGEEIELSDRDAASLLESGDIELVSGDRPGSGTQALSGPEILDAALRVLRGASAVEVGEFVRAMAEDPEIAGKVERAMKETPAEDHGYTRHERLVMAVRSLEEGNDAHWTKSGDARIEALEELTRLEDVSADERDAAQKEALAAQGDNA